MPYDKKKHQVRKGLKWNEAGFLELQKQQVKLRWCLCKDALQSRRYSIRLKKCYESKEQMLSHAQLEWESHEAFNESYMKVRALGWNCEWADYAKDSMPEGTFLPFVRFTKRRAAIVDTGCIWIGTRSSYPRIFVENSYCQWYFPINLTGELIWEPFVPFGQLNEHYNFLTSENSIQMFERRNERPDLRR